MILFLANVVIVIFIVLVVALAAIGVWALWQLRASGRASMVRRRAEDRLHDVSVQAQATILAEALRRMHGQAPQSGPVPGPTSRYGP